MMDKEIATQGKKHQDESKRAWRKPDITRIELKNTLYGAGSDEDFCNSAASAFGGC